MTSCLYYCTTNSKYYLHMDGCLRYVPEAAVSNLFSEGVKDNALRFEESSPPYRFNSDRDLPEACEAYIISEGHLKGMYLQDSFPWDVTREYGRPIVNQTQLSMLGVTLKTYGAEKVPNVTVPVEIDSGNNWQLATLITGLHACYNHLCHPENDINSYFSSWLEGNNNKASVRQQIMRVQAQIDALKGEVKPATPLIMPDTAPDHFSKFSVSLSCSQSNATIYYTEDGKDPEPGVGESTRMYMQPFDVQLSSQNSPIVIKAVSEYHDAIGISDNAVQEYTYNEENMTRVTANPPAGPFTAESVSISLSCALENVKIYYTTNNETPTELSKLYEDSFPIQFRDVGDEIFIKAIAVSNTDGSVTPVFTGKYTYQLPAVQPPIFSPQVKKVLTPLLYVSLRTDETNATIEYKIGNAATFTEYSDVPIELDFTDVSSTYIIHAKVIGADERESEIHSVRYESEYAWKHSWKLLEDSSDGIGDLDLTNLGDPVTFESSSGPSGAVFGGNSILTVNAGTSMSSQEFTFSAWIKVDSSIPMNSPFSTIFALQSAKNGDVGLALQVSRGGIKLVARGSNGPVTNQEVNLFDVGERKLFTLICSSNWLSVFLGQRTSPYIELEIPGGLQSEYCGAFSIGASRSTQLGKVLQSPFTGEIDDVIYLNKVIDSSMMSQYFEQQSTFLY